MTNHWIDIKNADVVLIMGGNAAEAHPCGFKWVTEAKAQTRRKLIVVDPRFTRSASVADFYAPIRPGTDIAFLLRRDQLPAGQRARSSRTTSKLTPTPRYIVKEGFGFEDGLFTGYRRGEARLRHARPGTTSSTSRASPRSTRRCRIRAASINLLKAHVERYTPEMVERICGTPKDKFLKVAELMASTANGERTMTSHVCARLDPAFQGLAEHPLHGDDPAAAGQHRRARRRHERAARPLQRPGPDRPRR